ncbi:hypothetical protein HK101_005342 [Irineochytrium annulatum]|nr:hypothetical protein HK101_005342 [Irineochytrium annulatum]
MLKTALVVTLAWARSAEEKVEKLEETLDNNPKAPIRLDSRSYNLFTEKPRNYSLFVVLTAMGNEYNCQPCK